MSPVQCSAPLEAAAGSFEQDRADPLWPDGAKYWDNEALEVEGDEEEVRGWEPAGRSARRDNQTAFTNCWSLGGIQTPTLTYYLLVFI